MSRSFSIITGQMVADTIHCHYDALFDAIRQVYIDHEQGKTINPNSYFLRFPNRPRDRIIALPAAIHAEHQISGIKWIASYPENVTQGFPRASAVIILNDYETGYPIACLEGSIISATRTAASAVLASETLFSSPKSIHCLGIIGNGLIAKYLISAFITRHWKLDKVCLYDLDADSTDKLASWLYHMHGIAVEKATSAETVVQHSDIVALTTTVSEPYLTDPAIFRSNQLILNLSLRDLSPDILIGANNVVDDIEHVLSANTSPHLTYDRYQTKTFIQGTIGQYLIQPYPLNPRKTIIFSPMGMGILDLAVAHFIYCNAHHTISIDDFFYEQER